MKRALLIFAALIGPMWAALAQDSFSDKRMQCFEDPYCTYDCYQIPPPRLANGDYAPYGSLGWRPVEECLERNLAITNAQLAANNPQWERLRISVQEVTDRINAYIACRRQRRWFQLWKARCR